MGITPPKSETAMSRMSSECDGSNHAAHTCHCEEEHEHLPRKERVRTMMLSNSLQWPNKIGAQRKAAHPSPMGRRQWSAQRCAEQQKVRKFQDQLDA